MLDTDLTPHPGRARAVPTPTKDALPRRFSDFNTLGEALDYAAGGVRGLNFHDAQGELVRVCSFRELRDHAIGAARRMLAAGIRPGNRIALVAENAPEFAALFFGAVYAGAWPVPLPLPTSFGGRESYLDQVARQLASSEPIWLLYPDPLKALVGSAATAAGLPGMTWQDFEALPAPEAELPAVGADGVAYLQYSSGSTRFPHGVMITHRALLSSLAANGRGMALTDGDRCVSWLPWYHDMGLVGCLLSPVANQVSTDYLRTADFARRPLAWLDLISRNPDSTVSYSPTFGYDICARRVSTQVNVAERFDLSRWRVAGIGSDMIRPDAMEAFVEVFRPAGFAARTLLPSYGLAEATLAVTLMRPGEGLISDHVEESRLLGRGDEGPAGSPRYREVVNCGKPVRGMEVAIRDDRGRVMDDGQIGKVFCRGPSVMAGYFRDEEATRSCLDADGWLDTGDMGYRSAGYLYIVGRAKDMILVNGRNHWPQDVEWAVEQLPGFKAGDIAAFSVTAPDGKEAVAVLVQCRVAGTAERARLKNSIRERVLAVTGTNCIVELVPPRTLPRTSSGKLSRVKARNLYLSGDIQPYDIAA